MTLQLVLVALLSLSTCVAASSPTHGVRKDARGYEIVAPQSPNLNGRDVFPLTKKDLPTGTCNSDTPCVNGACCGSDNLCGYTKKQCGTGCQSNCNAKAECGPYAVAATSKCPLNVCCSKFGFCGSTDEFCTWTNDDDPEYPACNTKWGGCGSVSRPSCGSGNSVSTRTIGYYETWSNSRKKSAVSPEDLNLNGFTHINFAFSFFDPDSFEITSMDSNAGALYQRFTKLKEKKDGLQAWISVGGWSFTDPGKTQKAFSNMVSTSGNRAKFISNLQKFMDTYGFDGVDLDWEYPGADDRGGVSADKDNYVTFTKELRAALGYQYGISMTLPTSYWYLQHFDVASIQENVDWFNLMAYDLHGTWDKASKAIGPYIAPHTNITEIDLGLDLLWRAGVDPQNVILGQGWYGRSFTLADPSCNVPNGVCQFSDAAKPGPISNAAGILTNQEISDIITNNDITPTWDKTAGVKWITWDSNQWVSYDDEDTFAQKRDFGNSRCLGGLMVWAMDQVDQSADNGLSPDGDVTSDDQADAQQKAADQRAKLVCRVTECDADCPKGTNEVTETNGQPGQLSTTGRCEKGKYRKVCCADGSTMGTCAWRGYRGVGLSCISGCDDGETEVATSINNHDKKNGDQNCNGGLQSYCCNGFSPPPSKAELKKEAEEAAKEAAKEAAAAAAEQAALDIAAKAFCRVAVPALLAPLELLEDLIPIVGEILDIAEVAATPALIQLCVKGVEKEGKAEFKVFGKKHTLSWDKPTTQPKTRDPATSHSAPKTSTKDACTSKRGVGLDKRACDRITKTEYTAATTLYQTTRTTCDGGRWPQACLHYESAINNNLGRAGFNPVTCSSFARAREFQPVGPATKLWAEQHKPEWKKWMRRAQKGCERDEWPPAHFWQGDPGQIVRYNHKEDNGGAGQLWNKFCPEHAPTQCEDGSEHLIDDPAKRYATVQCKKEVTIKVMSMVFDMEDVPLAQLPDDGLSANQCYPQMLVDDPTFALLNGDNYFGRHGRAYDPQFGSPPTPALIAGRNPPFRKRELPYPADDEFLVDTGNATRQLTPRERELLVQELEFEERERLLDEFEEQLKGYVECHGDECATQVTPAGGHSTGLPEPTMTEPTAVDATATASVGSLREDNGELTAPSSRSRMMVPDIPMVTAAIS